MTVWNKTPDDSLSQVKVIFNWSRTMNKVRTRCFVNFSSKVAALLTIVLAVALTSASARERKSKPSGHASRVVAHVSLGSLSTLDMAMQEQDGDKRYLYIQHSRDEGISVIDISTAAKPKVVGVIPWPDPAVSSHMNVTGNLALITETVALPAHSASFTNDLLVWDLSNPGAPQVVKKFSAVVRFLQDNRNFIYVLNSEGLWVISAPEPEQVDTSSYGG
jgi:hypothetical protein